MKTKIAFFMVEAFLFCMVVSQAEAQKPSLPSNVIPDGLGYNIHFTDAKPGEMEMLADSGATIIRMDFGWGGTEREKGVYDFSAFERLTDSLEKHNIRPLYILDYSNRHYDQGLSPYTDEGRAAFAKWAAAAAIHFKDRGILWEMYNEPNIHFWKPEPKPDDYIKLALETGKAIREAAPNELYIGPATSEIDLDFLEKCFQAGLLEYWDAVSVHPYRQKAPETVIAEYAKLRWMIDKYAPEGKHIPILSAEWGYSSAWGNYNDDTQGKMLPRQWMVNLACDVPISIWYDWHNDGTDPKEPEHHFGTTNFEYHEGRTPVYDPKPSYMAAKTFTETFRGFKYNKRIVVENVKGPLPILAGVPETFVLLFANDTDVRLAAWTTAKEPQTIVIPCSPGDFKAISYLGEELPDLVADENGLIVTVTDGPVYLIPEKPNAALNTVAKECPAIPMAVYLPGKNSAQFSSLMFMDSIPRTQLLNPVTVSREFHDVQLEQFCVVYQSEPLIVHTPMIEGDELVIRIDNPSGAQFVGSIHPRPIQGIALPPVYLQPKRFAIKEGETQAEERFRIVKRVGDSYTLSVDMYDYDAAPLTRETALSLKTMCPLDDFTKHDAASFTDAWQVLPDGDANVGSEQTLELTDEKLAKVAYKFEDGWKFLRLAPKKAMPIEGEPKSMTLRINADGSGNRIRMRFTDSQGQTFQPDGATMTREGRQYITFDLSGKDTSHWGGPNDGNISYPIRFDSIIIDGTRKACGPNSVEFASPVLVYE